MRAQSIHAGHRGPVGKTVSEIAPRAEFRPFIPDPSWFDDYWYQDRPAPRRRRAPRRAPAVVTALAVLTAGGSLAAHRHGPPHVSQLSDR